MTAVTRAFAAASFSLALSLAQGARADQYAPPDDHAGADQQTAPFASSVLAETSGASVSVGQSLPRWSVTPSGAFSYSIPIEIPSGRRGMQPKLALVYNSLAGNGLAGMGWALTGIPVIQRLNSGNGITFQGQDSYGFNVNGWGASPDPSETLVPMPSGSYHTLRESLADYRPRGSCGDGPCYWEMHDGKGNVLYFGGDGLSTPSQQSIGGTTGALWERWNGDVQNRGIVAWSLYRVTDRFGNSYRVDYQDSAASGSLYPADVLYVENPFGGIGATREVVFAYEPRADRGPPPAMFAQRLTSITAIASGNTVRRYALAYAAAGSVASGRTRLTAVQVLGSDLQPANGMPPITFGYQDGRVLGGAVPVVRVGGPRVRVPHLFGDAHKLFGDIDGDGRQDVVAAYQALDGRYIEYALGTAAGLGSNVRLDNTVSDTYDDYGSPNLVLSGAWNSLLADVNGDGMSDLVLTQVGPGGIGTSVALGSPGGLQPIMDSGNTLPWSGDVVPSGGFGCPGAEVCGWRVVAADVNDDHIADVVWISNGFTSAGSIFYSLGSPAGLQPVQPLSEGGFGLVLGYPLEIASGDFNGDAKSDVLVYDMLGNFSNGPFGPFAAIAAGGGAGMLAPTTGPAGISAPYGPWYASALGDFNGDGCTDVLGALTASQVQILWGRTGATGPTAPASVTYGSTAYPTPAFENQSGDFDGDGIADVLVTFGSPSDPTQWQRTVTLGGPSGPGATLSSADLTGPVSIGEYTGIRPWQTIGDINGDGRAEMLYMDYRNGTTTISTMQLGPAGLGAFTPLIAPESLVYDHCGAALGLPCTIGPVPEAFTVADLNGDGMADVLVIPPDDNYDGGYRIVLSNAVKPDLLTTVQNGIGETVTVSYQNAADVPNAIRRGTTYCGARQACPGVPNTTPRPLVTRVASDNGRPDGLRSTRYAYDNGRFFLGPRFIDNDQGFRSVTATDEQTGSYVETVDSMDRPLLRLPELTVLGNPTSITSQTAYEYGSQSFPSSGPFPPTTLTQPTQVTVQYFEDSGAMTRQIVDTSSYDAFGNALVQTHCDPTLKSPDGEKAHNPQ